MSLNGVLTCCGGDVGTAGMMLALAGAWDAAPPRSRRRAWTMESTSNLFSSSGLTFYSHCKFSFTSTQ